MRASAEARADYEPADLGNFNTERRLDRTDRRQHRLPGTRSSTFLRARDRFARVASATLAECRAPKLAPRNSNLRRHGRLSGTLS